MRVFPIIKCVGTACNLRCEYCYHSNSDQSFSTHIVMPTNVVEKLISEIIVINRGRCHCLWHGGEPMLAGINFFEDVVEIQKKFINQGAHVTNSIQTNGTLIDSRWARFFKEHDFGVGVSVDGPDHMHGKFRKYAGGQSSFKKTMQGIYECQKQDCNIGIIAVINSYNVQFPDELYSFFVKNGLFQLSFNPVFEIDAHGIPLSYSVQDDAFGDFLSAVFNRWIEDDDPNVVIRQFTDPLSRMCGGESSTCIFSGMCANFLEIYPDGSVYPCHRFKNEKIGSVANESFEEMFSGSSYKTLKAMTESFSSSCKKCKWLPFCNGGCSDHRMIMNEGSALGSYAFCGSRKKIFSKLSWFISSHTQ